jgi:hypothetical protein
MACGVKFTTDPSRTAKRCGFHVAPLLFGNFLSTTPTTGLNRYWARGRQQDAATIRGAHTQARRRQNGFMGFGGALETPSSRGPAMMRQGRGQFCDQRSDMAQLGRVLDSESLFGSY